LTHPYSNYILSLADRKRITQRCYLFDAPDSVVPLPRKSFKLAESWLHTRALDFASQLRVKGNKFGGS
jgi:hypothetical protein